MPQGDRCCSVLEILWLFSLPGAHLSLAYRSLLPPSLFAPLSLALSVSPCPSLHHSSPTYVSSRRLFFFLAHEPFSIFNIQPASPADEMRRMLVRRMSQRNRAEQEKMTKEAMREATEGAPTSPMTATMKLEQELAKKDTAMLDLQRRVEGESI